MRRLKWILAAIAGLYVALVAVLFLTQRSLLYIPDPARRDPGDYGIVNATVETLDTSDGEKVLVWHVPPGEGKPVVVYYQGNGGGLNRRADRLRRLTADGTGFVALNYRGYGGSTGSPTEAGILRDAAAAYRFAASRYGAERIVLWGESLGTGVAVATATQYPVARVILESPYTSTADVAAEIYFYVPVRWLMHDQFRSDERIAGVTAPVLVLHGARDRTVPIRFGERLYELIRSPKRFIRLAEAGHSDHEKFGALELLRPFILGQ